MLNQGIPWYKVHYASKSGNLVEPIKGGDDQPIRRMVSNNEYAETDRAWRQGVMSMLENVLMSTDNYKGFRYLAIDEVPTGCTPGIRRDRGEEKKFENTDNTRVRYF